MRFNRIVIVAFLLAAATLSYGQTLHDLDRESDMRDQAVSLWERMRVKYQLDVPALKSSGPPTPAATPISPPLLDRIDKAVVRSKMFEGAYRASKNVLSGTEGGVSYRDYSGLIQPLLAEAAILKDTAIGAADEELLAQAYSDAADVYASTGRFWSAALRHGADVVGYPWSIAKAISTKANEGYLRNYRAELAPSPAPRPGATPAVPVKKPKKSSQTS